MELAMQNLYREKEAENNLKETIAKVRQNFEWYNNLVIKTEYDKHPTIFNLPYIDELILDKFYYSVRDDFIRHDHVYFTSGTTKGIRKRILYSEKEHSLYLDHRKKIFSKFITANCKKACSDLGTGHAADSAASIFQSMGLKELCINLVRACRQFTSRGKRFQSGHLGPLLVTLLHLKLLGPASTSYLRSQRVPGVVDS